MYKSLLDLFNTKQLDTLRNKIWWQADTNKPFLVKLAIDGDFALLELTDMRNLWATRLHIKILLEQKVQYAKSLEIKENKDLLTLFQKLLSSSDRDALYLFKEAANNEMSFTFKKRIQVYDFNWTFRLQKINVNAVQLVCRELLSPLAAVLEAQTRRVDSLRRKFELIEKDYIRKMTQMEKGLYKSPLVQEQQDWQKMVPSSTGGLLVLHQLDRATQFFFTSYQSRGKKAEKQILQLPSARRSKPNPGKHSYQVEVDIDPVVEQQMLWDGEKGRKKKKLDFI